MNEEDCVVTSDEARNIMRRLGLMETGMSAMETGMTAMETGMSDVKAQVGDMQSQIGDMQARMEVLSSGEAAEAAFERVMVRRQAAADARRYNELKEFARLLVVRGAVALFGLIIGSAAVYRFILERVIS